MSERLIEALDVCLSALDNGADLDGCLELYPELAEELRPLLETALAASPLHRQATLPLPAMKRSRAALLSRAAELRAGRRAWLRLPEKLSLALIPLVLALVLILSTSGLYVASAKSLPGDSLYPFKRAVEQIRLQLAPEMQTKKLIEAGYSSQRIDEIKLLLDLARTQKVSFEGIVEEMGERRWRISGVEVIITSETKLPEEVRVGDGVGVDGETRPEGWVQAHEIHLQRLNFNGIVENIASDAWIVAGKLLEINPGSQLDASAQIGSLVQVMARVEDDGRLVALAILRQPEAASTHPLESEPSPQPTDEPTDEPSEEPAEESQENELTGIVEAIQDGYWIVAGQTIYITASTEIKDSIQVGDQVRLHVISQADGAWLAVEIKLEKDEGGGDDSASETPEAEETHPSETPEPEADPSESPEPLDDDPTETPEAGGDDASETPEVEPDDTEEPPDETPTPSP